MKSRVMPFKKFFVSDIEYECILFQCSTHKSIYFKLTLLLLLIVLVVSSHHTLYIVNVWKALLKNLDALFVIVRHFVDIKEILDKTTLQSNDGFKIINKNFYLT